MDELFTTLINDEEVKEIAFAEIGALYRNFITRVATEAEKAVFAAKAENNLTTLNGTNAVFAIVGKKIAGKDLQNGAKDELTSRVVEHFTKIHFDNLAQLQQDEELISLIQHFNREQQAPHEHKPIINDGISNIRHSDIVDLIMLRLNDPEDFNSLADTLINYYGNH